MLKQKAHLIVSGPDGIRGLDELNSALERGWQVVSTSPLGGAAAANPPGETTFCVGALVVVERSTRPAESSLEAVVEEEEVLDELVEGDGSNADIDVDTGI